MLLRSPQPGSHQSLLARGLHSVGGGRAPAALFDQGLVSGANFLTSVLLARSFGIREYGVFALTWIAVLFVNSLQYALVVTPMMSVGPKQKQQDRGSYYGAVLVQELVFAFIAAPVMGVSIRLSSKCFPQWGLGGLALPISLATLAYLLQDFLRRYFFCTLQSKRALITDVVSYVCQVPVIFWMSHSRNATLPNAFWIIAATSLAGFFACIRWFEPITLDLESFKAACARHWRISRWLAPTAFMQWGAGNLFLLSAPVYYGAAASATLRAANNIVGVAHIWFLGLDNVVPAEAARQMHTTGVDGLLPYIRRVFLQWGGVTLAFTSVIAAFPTFWLRLAYGTKYSADGTVLRLYAVLYLIVFSSGPLRAGLQALEYTQPIFWSYPLLIVFSVALAGPFARGLGLNGVIIGMCAVQVISQSVLGAALLLRLRKSPRGSALNRVESLEYR